MEMKRLGMIRKPMFAVPNHLVGQWAKDFLKLYPGAKILVPDKKDFEAVRRNRIMSKIATGDWDAVILPHSQFNLMDISPERQLVTLNKELDELEETYAAAKAAEGGKKGFTVKRLEKARDKLRARMAELKDLKADKTVRFDDLGVDHLFVDEAHAYKNLAFYTKMDRVSGLAQGDSKRATRLKMKTDYLLEKHGNRGVVFATGTPIQNTMAEMYNMIKYIAPDVLEKAGIRYFDDWAANFGETITAMELGVDGRTYKPRSKFARFTNVPELQQMFRAFADVKTKEDLNLPIPEIEGGKPQALTARPTPELEDYVKQLIERAKRCRGEGGPRPDPKIDNMLKVTGDGRKAATDLRLIDPNFPDDPDSKINTVVNKVHEEWESGNADKLTQAIFLDNYQYLEEVGAKFDEEGNQTKKGKETALLNLYRDMADKLVAKGVPRSDIAIIHDYDKQEQKTELFRKMNAGEVRILFGSTEKMGAGMNAQERMKSLIDVDSPWRPGDLEQRHGRILRQGNTNKTVRIYHAVTKGTFD
jgi:SNF2 family DNA or RNA helicase